MPTVMKFFVIFTFLLLFAPHVEARTIRVYTGTLNINTASAADLTRLPGVGEVIAFRIVKDREQRGKFRDIRRLERIKGISPRIYFGLQSYVATDGPNNLNVYLDLNTVTKPLLLGLPGMSEGEARSILNYRKGRGRLATVEELRKVPGIDDKRYAELREWLTVAR
ncbi:MAG: helix-hairpin-helix domain-containing protein [Geobacter sp.]|nr:helix-hairpin-helix domain-containing protein [Geobacter sp.]